ncbi:MAG TPA: hypothetical protein VF070_31075 [Streptosporangiaceae bacterium]
MTTSLRSAAASVPTALSRLDSPLSASASASFGSSTSVCAIAADKPAPPHRPVGSQLVSSDVVAPAARAAVNSEARPGPSVFSSRK